MVRPRNGVVNEQAPDVNEAAQVMLYALTANMGHAPAGPRVEIADIMERFRLQRSLTFSKSTNSIQADNWIRKTELAFKLITCSKT